MRSIVFAEHLTFPENVNDLATFRQWVTSEDFPENARVSYLNGKIWVDLPMERAAHNLCKNAINITIANLVDSEVSGLYFSDGMLLSNPKVGLSTQPDFMFIANKTLSGDKVTLLHGGESIEVIGSPDMTLEVISPTSVEKDTVDLLRLYWAAGVHEYWLVDSREKSFSFEILRRTSTKFVPTRKQDGWVKSRVFKKEFRLTKQTTRLGISKFTLEAR
jgi:Uma2 family endonuclease